MLINVMRGEIAQRTEKDAGGGEIEVTGSLKSKGASPWRNSGIQAGACGWKCATPSSAFPRCLGGRGGDGGGRGGWEGNLGEGREGIQPRVRPTGTKPLWSTQGEMAVSVASSGMEGKEKRGKETKIPVILMAHANLPGPVHPGCLLIN